MIFRHLSPRLCRRRRFKTFFAREQRCLSTKVNKSLLVNATLAAILQKLSKECEKWLLKLLRRNSLWFVYDLACFFGKFNFGNQFARFGTMRPNHQISFHVVPALSRDFFLASSFKAAGNCLLIFRKQHTIFHNFKLRRLVSARFCVRASFLRWFFVEWLLRGSERVHEQEKSRYHFFLIKAENKKQIKALRALGILITVSLVTFAKHRTALTH